MLNIPRACFILLGLCVASGRTDDEPPPPMTADEIQQIQSENEVLEQKIVPSKGTFLKDVESHFGKGMRIVASKVQPKSVPADSLLRSYNWTKHGTMLVQYERWQNKDLVVKHASYVNPFATKGRPPGQTLSLAQQEREVMDRRRQLHEIQKHFRRLRDPKAPFPPQLPIQ